MLPKIKNPMQLSEHIIHNMKMKELSEQNQLTISKYISDPLSMERESAYFKYVNLIYEDYYFKQFKKKGIIGDFKHLHFYYRVDDFFIDYICIIYLDKRSNSWIWFDPLWNEFNGFKFPIRDDDNGYDKMILTIKHKFAENLWNWVDYEEHYTTEELFQVLIKVLPQYITNGGF